MSPRKIVKAVLAALLAGAAWAGTAGLAYAGGPTSVLIASPTAQRAAGLYYRVSLRGACPGHRRRGRPARGLAQPTRERRPRQRNGGQTDLDGPRRERLAH